MKWIPIALLLVFSAAAAAQSVEAGRNKAQSCVACHGPDGNSSLAAYPVLAGQPAAYITQQLEDYRNGRRKDGEMTALAAALVQQDVLDLAAYFSAQKPRRTGFDPVPAKAARGSEKVAEKACAMCHLQGFAGQNEIPRVAGQQYSYIVKQLRDYREARRTNDAGNMVPVVQDLSDRDIEDIAHYLADLE